MSRRVTVYIRLTPPGREAAREVERLAKLAEATRRRPEWAEEPMPGPVRFKLVQRKEMGR